MAVNLDVQALRALISMDAGGLLIRKTSYASLRLRALKKKSKNPWRSRFFYDTVSIGQ